MEIMKKSDNTVSIPLKSVVKNFKQHQKAKHEKIHVTDKKLSMRKLQDELNW